MPEKKRKAKADTPELFSNAVICESGPMGVRLVFLVDRPVLKGREVVGSDAAVVARIALAIPAAAGLADDLRKGLAALASGARQ